MEERELITLAFGNYATLVAAQWANGTSQFDMHHHTLYNECSRDRLYLGGTGLSSSRCRVPRLLLFDAPHVSVMKDMAQVEEEMNASQTIDREQEEEEGAGASLLFGKKQQGMTAEEKQLEKMVRYAEEKWSGGYTNEANDEAEEDDYYTVDAATGEGEDHPSTTALFSTKDRYVPWWRYIHSGLPRGAVVNLSARTDTEGEVPAMHSFGYGLRRGQHTQEVETFSDRLRCQVEEADHFQGLNNYIDGDTLFGGVAVRVLQEFWEDNGPKVPATLFTCFSPLPAALTDHASAASIAFSNRRRAECALNRLLATRHLSAHGSSVYVPIELGRWGEFFEGQNKAWLEDDTATAQYVAAVTDTALYGLRDGAPGVGERVSTPACYLQQWCNTVQPLPSLPISALLGALPVSLQGHHGGRCELWELLSSLPLLPGTVEGGNGYRSLTHAITASPRSDAGRVIGSAVTLRGAAGLECTKYPAQEALLRYGLPLYCDQYLPVMSTSQYPISGTCPASVWAEERGTGEDVSAPATVATAAHVVTTYSTATMLKEILEAARPLLRNRPEYFFGQYDMEKEDWTDTMEAVNELYDNYRHDDYMDSQSDEDGDW